MTTLLLALAGAWVFVVALLVLVLLVEVLAGWSGREESPPAGAVPPYVVLIPAHDESGTIQGTIEAVRAQLPASARVLVVADNCSDRTAADALAAGAEVAERHDPLARGKGHALAFGIRQLRSAPPAVVIVLDADCVPTRGSLDLLAARASALGRPVQALDLMSAPAGSSLRLRMAAFAWALKNHLRPLGLHRLGLPCQLMGTGMAFPWECIGHAELASSHLAEDLQLGVMLAASGHAASYCPQARVDSWFPQEGSAQSSQRTRWEHGHLSTILAHAPALLAKGLRSRNAGAIALALDLFVPPLALLALLVLSSCAMGTWALLFARSGFVAGVAWVSAIAFATSVLLAWWRVGRRWVSGAELLAAPAYVLGKLPIYAGFVVRRQREWVRTGRQR